MAKKVRSVFEIDRRAELRSRLRQKRGQERKRQALIALPEPLPQREVVTRLIARVRTL